MRIDSLPLFLLVGTLVQASEQTHFSAREIVPRATCKTHTIVSGDYCDAIAAKYSVTTQDIINWNTNTFGWKGCGALQITLDICVSAGTPPPPKVNPDLQCGPQSPGNATCPLRACCSAYGFCGLTDEFCDKASNGEPCISNCGKTTLKTCGGGLSRKVGYYAGWAARRPCDKFKPQDLDLTGFTHVIFAFATITESMEIAIAPEDQPLLRDLANMKWKYPGLKVSIAVGGWAFSTEAPTKSLFSVMIDNPGNRANFIISAQNLIYQYGLDGLDVDMEYPGAIERDAPATDTAKLTEFLVDLRSRFKPDQEITIATPASFWFLKGFELDKIINSVDYINMMSYDYHGSWDMVVKGEDGTGKPHTSIKDIEDSAKLYTRAGIDLKKVNLGLAWYGRTYNVGSCKGPKCKMTGGGAPGTCTGASGYLSQKEIWDSKPSATLDTETQTYWYNKGDDFITYDDQATWKVKTDFASKYCFGGTMIWSLDQAKPSVTTSKPDTPDPLPSNIPVSCGSKPADNVIRDCKVMVRDIVDTNRVSTSVELCVLLIIQVLLLCDSINLKTIDVQGLQLSGRYVMATAACRFIAMPDPRNGTFEAREIKQAAQSILDTCYTSGAVRRDSTEPTSDLGSRALPILAAIAARWVVAAVQFFLRGEVSIMLGWIRTLLVFLWRRWTKEDEQARRNYVIKTIDESWERNPEMNIIIAHSKHKYNFTEPYHHTHVELDEHIGTYGYEIYYVRNGTFELLGDGDWMNWGYQGYIKADAKNPKKLTLYTPGVSYGVSTSQGRVTDQGKTETVDIAVGLGNKSGCLACFGV